MVYVKDYFLREFPVFIFPLLIKILIVINILILIVILWYGGNYY